MPLLYIVLVLAGFAVGALATLAVQRLRPKRSVSPPNTVDELARRLPLLGLRIGFEVCGPDNTTIGPLFTSPIMGGLAPYGARGEDPANLVVKLTYEQNFSHVPLSLQVFRLSEGSRIEIGGTLLQRGSAPYILSGPQIQNAVTAIVQACKDADKHVQAELLLAPRLLEKEREVKSLRSTLAELRGIQSDEPIVLQQKT